MIRAPEHWGRVFFQLLFAIVGCASPSASDTYDRLAASRAPDHGAVDYGQEVSRQLTTDDELIATLHNGLVVIARRVPSPVLSVRAYARTGSVYEGELLGGGVSHLLEHLVAGCTNGRRTEEQNRDLLQSIGNNSNAYTDFDHTAYYVNTTAEHLNEAVDLVSGWMFSASIVPVEFEREREVVQRELEKDKGEPDVAFSELTFANRYRANPARVPIIGYQEVIRRLTREDVYGYYRRAYVPNNVVFAVAGNLPPQQMLRAVQENVRAVPPGRTFSHDIDAEPQVTGPRTIVATFPQLGAARLELAWPSVTLDHPDLYALDLLSAVVGGGESSILVEELRDRRRLVDSVTASDFTPTYVEGSFVIDLELDVKNLRAATAGVMELIDRIKTGGVDRRRLARAKTQMRIAHLRGRQTTEEVVEQMAIDYLNTGDAHFTDIYLERIDQLTAEQLQDVARRYLVSSKLITTALVPGESSGGSELPRAEDLLRGAAPTSAPSSAATRPATAPSITRRELPDGTVLLHKRLTTSPLVAIHMYALGGLSVEDEATNGLGNLTMQMLPRGTKTRSASELAAAFDELGAEMETDCGTNTWSWNASCLKGDLRRTIELFADVRDNPAFSEEELHGVKQRTQAAIESLDSDWFVQSQRFFRAQFFADTGSPYRFVTLGGTHINAFTVDQLRRWYHSRVLAAPRVLAIFGDVELPDAEALAREHFAASSRCPKIPIRQVQGRRAAVHQTVPSIAVSRVEVHETEQPLAGVWIGFKSDSTFTDADRFAALLADCMTSGYGGPTGYLFDTLRGRGLVYQTDAQDWPGLSERLPGGFFAHAGCDPQKVNEVVDLMLLNLARLQGSAQDVQPGWFERSKRLIVTQDAVSSETADAQARIAALDELYGRGFDAHAKFADQVNALSLDAVQSYARTRLRECVIAVCTPRPQIVNRTTGTRQFNSFPPVELTGGAVNKDADRSR